MPAQPHGSRFKGTRSQLRLSDFFSKLPPQSPLKVARSALHNPPVRLPAALATSETNNADDAIHPPRKRASGDDERARGHKRPRRNEGPSAHALADPHDQDRPLDLPTSHSCILPLSGQPEQSPPVVVTRTQSVPAFLFSTPGAVGAVPRLDLTKVGGTPSPRRVYSSGKLRIRSIPPADVHVPPLKIADENTEDVTVRLPKMAGAGDLPGIELISKSGDEPLKSGLVNSIPSPEIPIATNHTAGIQQTPRYTYPLNLDLGSPLTPLPPTPHPTKRLATQGDRKPSRSGLRFELEAARVNADALPCDGVVAPLRLGAKSSLPTAGSQPRTASQSGHATDLPTLKGSESQSDILPANGIIASSSMPVLTGKPSPSMISRMKPKPKTDSSRPIFARNPRMTRSVSKGLVPDTRADAGPDTKGTNIDAVGVDIGHSAQPVKPAIQDRMRAGDMTVCKTTKILPGHAHDKSQSSNIPSFGSAPAFGITSVKPPASPTKRPVSVRSPSKTQRVPSSSQTSPSKKPASSPGRLIRSSSVCSTLSTLSNALDKLTLPPPKKPTRPSTSLGFNRDNGQSLPPDAKEVMDDVDVGTSAGRRSDRPRKVSGLGLGRPSTANGHPSRTRISGPQESAVEAAAKAMAKATVTAFGPGAGRAPLSVAAGSGRVGSRDFGRGRGGRVATLSTFGFGARVGPRASKKTTLSSVAASPIKGGDGGGSVEQDAEVRVAASSTVTKKEEEGEEAFWAGESVDKGKGKAKERDEWIRRASRRASLASHALSHSLDVAPEASLHVPGSGRPMRPPESTEPLASNNVRVPSAARATRSAAGVQDRARSAQVVGQAGATVGNKKGKEANVVKKVLDGCTVFVDVKSQEGDEAGSLFVDMCAQMGAKILQRLGQSCTHIVFKNGLMSTITKYRLLKDPKPSVVNIAWVVDVAEQRVKLDEAAYSIDLYGMNVAGIPKRRRSMLPKHVQIGEDGVSTLPTSSSDPIKIEDQSLDAPSSILSNDDLPPLEKARRRQLTMSTRSDLDN